MSIDDSVAKVSEAITELQRTTIPLVREMINVLQKSNEQIGHVNRDMLHVVNANLDNVANAAGRLAASGTQLAADLMDRGLTTIRPTDPVKPRPASGPTQAS